MREIIVTAAQLCSYVTSVAAVVVLIVKPLRERVLGVNQIKAGQRCLLRADMLSTYYKHRENQQIRQYEFENFCLEYKAYKALGGNSFIEHIKKEVDEWEVVT